MKTASIFIIRQNSYLRKNPGKIWRIAGDCDSLSPEIKKEYACIIRKIPDQETNGQTKAVQYLAVKGISRMAIIAATQVSIFNFSAKEMSATGLKYPIRAFTSLWQGTLNQTISGSFTINADGAYLVFINYHRSI